MSFVSRIALPIAVIALGFCFRFAPAGAAPRFASNSAAKAKGDSRRLFTTVGKCDLAAMADLLRNGANPNVTDPMSRTPLMYASMAGNAELVSLLLRYRANVNARDSIGFTPLMASMIGRSAKTARLLLRRGADPRAANKAGGTALSLAMAAHDLPTARLLLDHGFPVDQPAVGGETPLYQAASAGDEKFISLFLAKRANLEAATIDGFTPLMAAAGEGRLGAVRLLLTRGAKVNARSQDGDTPLMVAAGSRNVAVGRLLLDKGAKVTAKDSRGRTALMRACAAPDGDVADLLISRHADVRAVDQLGGTALMRAAAHGNVGAVKALLAAGADPNATDRSGLTALTRAAALNSTDIVEALRAAGAIGSGDAGPARAERIRAAVSSSVPLIQMSADTFTERTGGACFSCHHHGMAAFAVRAARDAGFSINRRSFTKQAAAIAAGIAGPARQVAGALKGAKALEEARKQDDEPGINFGYGLLAMEAVGAPASTATEATAAYLMLRQEKDGGWTGPQSNMRFPAEKSAFTSTALAIRGIGAYAPKPRTADVAAIFVSARKWLCTAPAKNTEDKAFRLLGLMWCGAKPGDPDVRSAAADLFADQRVDGGWAQEKTMASDSYATGEALFALREAGAPPTDPKWSKGIDFLLRDQDEDGSWMVKSRAIPIQGYINSGFPHGRSQYISINASCWATMALAAAGSPARTASR